MGIVTDYLRSMIARQVDDHGQAVQYDPEGRYREAVDRLSIPDTRVVYYESSFFALHYEIEPLQIGMNNGARRALIPLENKRHFLDVSADIMERVDPVFYGDSLTAAMKALGMN